ncbi:MAG: exodeoxyribonuclease III [Planctomycetaceae bacterium]|nr:exodeoxyribonuclease III [Planctomycetaceae bacterium]
MRLVTLNCNGIRAADKKGLRDFLTSLAADIVCFQEVRATTDQIPTWANQPQSFWLPAVKNGYSGVGVVTQHAVQRVRTGIGDPQVDEEGRVQRLDFKDWTLINAYFPSGSAGEHRQNAKYHFLNKFDQYIRHVMAEQPRLLVCGDFNIAHHPIDLKNWKSNQTTSGFLPEERQWLTDFSSLGFVDVVRRLAGSETAVYSWWSQRAGSRQRDVGWRLDYQWASPDLAAGATAFQIPREPVFSDHAPVVVDYQWS